MKKSATFLTLFLIIFSLSLTLAAENETTEKSDIEKGFECLEEKANECSGLTTQEIAITILATPGNIFDECVDELRSKQSSNNWGNVRDTALAILALKHAGKDTEPAEEWLISQNKTPTNLIWYLQQNSDEAVTCSIGYNTNNYPVDISENKKIDTDAGPCLTRTSSRFWLEISNNCYDEKFNIQCDKDFIANLIFRNRNTIPIHVLEGTSSAPALGSVELQVKSRCFGDNSCDYEATAWAAIALDETDHDIEEYIPYLIAMSESNKQYLPASFIYLLKSYNNYADSLIQEQKLAHYWEAESSAYNKYYDTSLALITLSSLSGSTAEQIPLAKEWLLFSQGANGCWQNSVLETAMALWALEGKAPRATATSTTGDSEPLCSEANFFCIPSAECPSSEDVSDNYFCGLGDAVCCETENLKSCEEYGGQKCASDKICTGNLKRAADTSSCCTGSCEDKPQENQCEANFYSCMDTCSEYQEPISQYSCDYTQVCCKTKTTSTEETTSSTWWIWVLIVLILAVLGAIAYLYREQLKLYWFQLKIKFKKDKGTGSGTSKQGPSGPPPRPGFPPVRRPHAPTAQPRKQAQPARTAPQRSYDRRDKAMSETFKRLQDMSK